VQRFHFRRKKLVGGFLADHQQELTEGRIEVLAQLGATLPHRGGTLWIGRQFQASDGVFHQARGYPSAASLLDGLFPRLLRLRWIQADQGPYLALVMRRILMTICHQMRKYLRRID
jgi:hypothetical protein